MNESNERSKSTFSPCLTAGQAAQHCRVSLTALRRWVRDGRLQAFKTPGRHRRIPLDEFQRFLRDHGMPPYPTPQSEVRILIVDDQPSVVALLADFLSGDPRGFKLETASDGYEALIKVGAFKPSVLILDVCMPEVDGVEVCRRLKADPGTRAIKILGISGYPDRIPELAQAGADASLTKPLDLERLRLELDRLLPTRES